MTLSAVILCYGREVATELTPCSEWSRRIIILEAFSRGGRSTALRVLEYIS